MDNNKQDNEIKIIIIDMEVDTRARKYADSDKDVFENKRK